MKLVIATPLYPPESGGPATFSELLETELPKHGWEVTLVTFSSVRHLPKLVRHLAYTYKVYKAATRADAILALDPVSTGFPTHLAAHLAHKPYYVKIVGDYAWEQGTQRFGIKDTLDVFVTKRHLPLQVRVLRSVQEHVARGAQQIIVPSRYWQRLLTTWNVPSEKVRVVYNAARHFEESYPRPIPGPYIVSISRLVPWKGFAGVIRAFKTMSETDSELSLVIVGGGPEAERLTALTEELGLNDKVIFTGALPQGEAPAYLKHAEAFVLNTSYEGFSHLILEAFALGTPVITTPVGGNTEQVTDGETGLLVPVDDTNAIAAAVKRVRTEPELRARLTAQAAAKLKQFSQEQLVHGVMETLAI